MNVTQPNTLGQPANPSYPELATQPPPTPSTTAIVVPPPPMKPTKPNKGTFEKANEKTFVLAFGGEPNPDFDGLADPDNRKLRNTMYRPLDPKTDGKMGKLVKQV